MNRYTLYVQEFKNEIKLSTSEDDVPLELPVYLISKQFYTISILQDLTFHEVVVALHIENVDSWMVVSLAKSVSNIHSYMF